MQLINGLKIDQIYWLKMGHKSIEKWGPKTTQKGVPNDPFGGTPQNGHFGVTWAPPLPPPNLTRGYVRSFTGPPLFKRRGYPPPKWQLGVPPPNGNRGYPPKRLNLWPIFQSFMQSIQSIKHECINLWLIDWMNRLIELIDCINWLKIYDWLI